MNNNETRETKTQTRTVEKTASERCFDESVKVQEEQDKVWTPCDEMDNNPDKDGGYGWIVVIASFFNMFIIDGVGSSFGLLFPSVVRKYEVPASVASLAGSLFVAMMIMGALSAELVRRFGYRVVSMAGGVLGCGAFVVSSFSPNIALFILTYGLMAGSSNILGRLISGFLASLHIDPLTINNLSLVLGAVTCLLSPLYKEFWALCILATFFGFFLGFFPPLQPLLIVEYFGLGSLATAFGFLTTIKGVATILGPPLAGWIYDTSGDHSMMFVFAGTAFISSALVHCTMPCAKTK